MFCAKPLSGRGGVGVRRIMPNNIPKVKECDARDDAMKNCCWLKTLKLFKHSNHTVYENN